MPRVTGQCIKVYGEVCTCKLAWESRKRGENDVFTEVKTVFLSEGVGDSRQSLSPMKANIYEGVLLEFGPAEHSTCGASKFGVLSEYGR
jgi:hypothetical protein